MKKVFVTGGAGYIGSHVVKMLGEKGYDVLTFDNLSNGHTEAVLAGDIVTGDLADTELLKKALSSFQPDVVMHFAAFIQVEESLLNPLNYYTNNTVNTIHLLRNMDECNIRHFVFSSTAALYGYPGKVPIDENEPLRPVNPYGRSKAFIEEILHDLTLRSDISYVSLRYFNAAGADPSGSLGERHDPETHLIPRILKAAKGDLEKVIIYGSDYDTPDGTCIRDYIHVNDLAEAHILAMEYLFENKESKVYNLGYGHGYSVKEVVETAKKITGVDFPVINADRRAGDSPELVADSSKIKRELDWKPKYDDIEYLIKTAWEWERSL